MRAPRRGSCLLCPAGSVIAWWPRTPLPGLCVSLTLALTLRSDRNLTSTLTLKFT